MVIKPLFLVGYMGCGKSSMGRKVARRLAVSFSDTDTIVENSAGASIYDIFQFDGEPHFRELEQKALLKAIKRGGVVSTGGGLPLWGNNMELMNNAGLTVYLRRDPAQIIARLTPYGRQKRPRLRGLTDDRLLDYMTEDMAQRDSYYAMSHVVIDCRTISDDQILELIVERFDSLLELNRSM